MNLNKFLAKNNIDYVTYAPGYTVYSIESGGKVVMCII